MILSFVNPVIKNQWDLGDEINYVYSCVFLGFLLGSASSGKITDKFSRRHTILLCGICKIIFSIISCLSQNLTQYLITRLCYAYFIGLSIAPTVSTVIEITPLKKRGVVNACFVGIPFCLGELVAAIVAEFTLKGDNDN